MLLLWNSLHTLLLPLPFEMTFSIDFQIEMVLVLLADELPYRQRAEVSRCSCWFLLTSGFCWCKVWADILGGAVGLGWSGLLSYPAYCQFSAETSDLVWTVTLRTKGIVRCTCLSFVLDLISRIWDERKKYFGERQARSQAKLERS